MLDIGKLIPARYQCCGLFRFSSMLDIGKLIPEFNRHMEELGFSSMLDIGKLIHGPDRCFRRQVLAQCWI